MPRHTLLLSLVLAFAPLVQAQDFDAAGEQGMLDRINAMRLEGQLAALTRDPRLDAAARAHSQDMASHQALSHVSQQAGTPSDRVRAAGFAATTVTENVALHRSANDAYQALLQSDPHRANMLNPDATHVGLGAVRTERGVYITQLFAAAQPPPAAAPPAPPPAIVQAPTAPPTRVEPPAPPVSAVPPVAAAPRPPPASIQPQAGSNGTVLLERDATGRVQAYWVFGSGRWWYYPLPANAVAGQQLTPDRSVTGPPPGFGAAPPGVAPAPQPAPTPAYGMLPPPPAPAQPPPPQAGGMVIDPFAGSVQLPGGAYYSVPPPPFVGQPSRAWQRAQARWQRAYQHWLQQQQQLQQRAF